MRILFLLGLFLITTLSIFSQEKELNGRIVADSLDIFSVQVINYTKRTGTITKADGSFLIKAAISDSIIISSLPYELKSFIVTEQHFSGMDLIIKLQPAIQKLEPVSISSIELSGNLTEDSKNIETSPFVNAEKLGLPVATKKPLTGIRRKIYTAKAGPVDILVNTLNGKIKKLKKIRDIQDYQKIVEKGIQSFPTLFFTEDLKLPEDYIADFVYYCALDETYKELLSQNKKIDLQLFFEGKVESYRKLKGI